MSYLDDVLNKSATTSVASVLGSSNLLKIKDFTFGGHTFKTNDLAHMYHEVTNPLGKLNVAVDMSYTKGAYYKAKDNTLYLSFAVAGDLPKQGLIVHESTHALYDFKKAKMDIGTSEAIAYIVQCQFAKANYPAGADDDDRLWDSGDDDWVFDIGWRIATKLLDGGSIDSSDEADMRQAVTKHSNYVTNYQNAADFDGM